MKKHLCVFALLATSLMAFADTPRINQTLIMSKLYTCTNGGQLQLVPTRYGNVKQIFFSRVGSPSSIGYVHFYRMTDHYKGEVYKSVTFPDPKSGEDSSKTDNFADMIIQNDSRGLVLSLTPRQAQNRALNFSCKNY